jgi:hypothetical protein
MVERGCSAPSLYRPDSRGRTRREPVKPLIASSGCVRRSSGDLPGYYPGTNGAGGFNNAARCCRSLLSNAKAITSLIIVA